MKWSCKINNNKLQVHRRATRLFRTTWWAVWRRPSTTMSRCSSASVCAPAAPRADATISSVNQWCTTRVSDSASWTSTIACTGQNCSKRQLAGRPSFTWELLAKVSLFLALSNIWLSFFFWQKNRHTSVVHRNQIYFRPKITIYQARTELCDRRHNLINGFGYSGSTKKTNLCK